MSTSAPSAPEQGTAIRLRAEDIVRALAKRNPGAPRATLERVGRLVALVSEAVVDDAEVVRRIANLTDDGMRDVAREIASGLTDRSRNGQPAGAVRAVERVRGSGLGPAIGREAGTARLVARAPAAPVESWAGPLLAADELLAAEGVTPDVLDGWRRSRAVVELPIGRGQTAYPVRQFADKRPIDGLAEVQAIVGEASAAWLWLVEADGDGAPSWLDRLDRGEVDEVLEAARQDFR